MSELKIGRMVLGSVQTNCFYIYREGQKEVICVDPADQGNKIFTQLQKKGLQISGIILTHGHFDHILGVKELKKLSGAKIYAYKEEKCVLENPSTNVSAQVGSSYVITADEYLEDGALVTIGDMTFNLIATPGHTVGSCCYYFKEDKVLISGDTLFLESVGRSDLPTGSGATLGRSIKNKLMILPDDVKVYPGHGDSTSIGHERIYNPYC